MKQPIIGVHLLTEFTFCSRAGLCTRETTTDEEPESAANLNFLPDLDEQEIRQAIHQRGIRGLGFAFASLISAALALALTVSTIAPATASPSCKKLVWHVTLEATAAPL